jgi:uncharacterized protein YutE (UPF0331/DUF86 family)
VVVDRPKLDHMLSSLRAYTAVLRGLASVPGEAFLANPDKVGNAKYHFVIAIECCVDLANHVIASEGFRIPKSNADGSAVLTERGVLPPDLRDPLRAMAQFRNRLVHLYWEVDDALVHQYLQDSLDDLDRFARAVAAYAS